MDLMKFYNHMPILLQNVAVSAQGYRIQRKRYGKLFNNRYSEYAERSSWSYQQKCEYRDKMLHKMIKHCYETVPYYRTVMMNLGLTPDDFQNIEDLKKLPIINKQTVQENFEEFFSYDYEKKNLIRLHTSGSTGAGFVFYQDAEADASVWAHVWRGNNNLGLMRNTWCAYFGGRAVVPHDCRYKPFYRVNYPGKQIMFSIYHMQEDNLKSYIEALNDFQTPWIQGYPSALLQLAEYMIRNDISLTYIPKIITVSSEGISEQQAFMIEEAFGIYPIQNYAQSEGVATFRQRLDRRIFVDEDFSAVELIDQGDGMAKIIGTSLTNYAMPFIRYDTGDLATWAENEEGREIISIEGRLEDYIRLPDGRKIRRISRVFQEQTNIAAAQLYQKKDGSVTVYLVKKIGFGESDELYLKESLVTYFHGLISYELIYVDHIPKLPNGKTRFIISEYKE